MVSSPNDGTWNTSLGIAAKCGKSKTTAAPTCVVGGFRYNEGKPVVGSLLLGLYDDDGLLHHVGFTSTIKRQEKAALTRKLEALIAPPGFTGDAPGGPQSLVDAAVDRDGKVDRAERPMETTSVSKASQLALHGDN